MFWGLIMAVFKLYRKYL